MWCIYLRGGLQDLSILFDRDFEKIKQIFYKYDGEVCSGKIDVQGLWKIYCEELVLTENATGFDFANFWAKHHILIPETITLLDSLKNSGLDFGALSNSYPGNYDLLLKNGILPEIQWTERILSCEVGFAKPSQEVYDLAQRKTGFKPNQILFVDDKEEFLMPARDRGWKTLLFDYTNPSRSIVEIQKILGLT